MLFADKKIKFTVTGMHCNHCKAKVEKAVSAIEGVKAAVADPKACTLVIKVDKNVGDEINALVINAVEACGFKASI